MEPQNSMQHALASWQQGEASLKQVRALAADLGNEHYSQGIPALMQLLDHEDEIVRFNAIISLAFEFHHDPVSEKLLAFVASDPDGDCRGAAAGGLGTLFQDAKDRRILRALGYSALHDPDEYVRSSAYHSLQIVNGVSRDQHLAMLRDQSLKVDPAIVERILAGISE